jgi:TolB-like protein/cytochrome c-type biogenesis protein CcmH/NrfG
VLSFFEELKRRNVVRVGIAYLALSWLLTEVAGTLFPGFGIPDWAFRFVVIVLVLGFMPVLIFSWAYEMTPEGLKRESDVVRDPASEPRTARRLDLLTIGLIVVALGFIAVDRLWLGSGEKDMSEPTLDPAAGSAKPAAAETFLPPDSIAVLPFANRSANPEDVFFVDGIHDDLLTYISQIGALKTISRTSVMKYRDSTLSIPKIAGELGVATVLEGGVQRAGEQVRINVQLIDARTDDHLWSQIYDRRLTAANVFTIQSEIAEAIATALRATLTSEEQARIRSVPTENLQALEAYFLGKQHMALRRSADLSRAGDYFDKAVELDPEFALAWVGLADTWILHRRDLSREESLTRSQSAAERALQLDPNLGEAYAADAKRRDWQGDFVGAEAAFRRALQLTPNYAPAYQWYGQMLEDQPGRIDEALAMHRRATELDPQSAIIFNDFAGGLMAAGRIDEALANFRKAVEIEPRFTRGYWGIANIQIFYKGRLDEGIIAVRAAVASEPDEWRGYNALGAVYLALGDVEQAQMWAERAGTMAPEDTVPEILCQLNRYRGENAEAWACAERLLDAEPRSVLGLLLTRDMAVAQGDLARALSRFERGYPELLDERVTDLDRSQRDIAPDLAHLLYRIGEQAQAGRLFDQAMAAASSDPGFAPARLALLRATIHAVRGNNAEALRALQQAVDLRWRMYAWYDLQLNPLLADLHETPEFKALRAEVEEELATQLARVREWEASGKLAPVPKMTRRSP